MDLTDVKVKRERKPNWTPDETLHLCTLVEGKAEVIRGKFGPHVTNAHKRAAWDQVSDGMNAAFPNVIRSAADCERRWYTVLRKGRKDLSSYKKQCTGTGKKWVLCHLPNYC